MTSIEESHSKWAIKTNDSSEAKLYDDVIIAAPFRSTGIKLSSSKSHFAEIPPQPYVHLHVTLLTTTAPYADPVYFGLKPEATVPSTIFTTYEGVRNGGPEPEFNSLSFHGPISEGSEEQVVKIFSKQRVEDDWLNKVFGGKVGWVFRKEVRLSPIVSCEKSHKSLFYFLCSGKLIQGYLPPPSFLLLYSLLDYIMSMHSNREFIMNCQSSHLRRLSYRFISTMETETISSRNIVDLIFQERFSTGLCGRQIVDTNEDRQTFLGANSNITTQTAAEFVYGWDC